MRVHRPVHAPRRQSTSPRDLSIVPKSTAPRRSLFPQRRRPWQGGAMFDGVSEEDDPDAALRARFRDDGLEKRAGGRLVSDVVSRFDDGAGDPIGAEQAVELGLANRLVPSSELDTENFSRPFSLKYRSQSASFPGGIESEIARCNSFIFACILYLPHNLIMSRIIWLDLCLNKNLPLKAKCHLTIDFAAFTKAKYAPVISFKGRVKTSDGDHFLVEGTILESGAADDHGHG
jgi:hypothetical protein